MHRKVCSLYLEFDGMRVCSSESWDEINPEKAMLAVKALREILGKPTELSGRFL